MKRLLSLALILLVSSVSLNSQARGTPSTLRVRVDANGYLIVAGATQTNPVTSGTFSTRVLRTDASGNLLVVFTGGSFSGQLLGPDGTAAAPTYSFSVDPNSGMYRPGAQRIGFSILSVPKIFIDSSNGVVRIASDLSIAWNSGTNLDAGSVDLSLFREGADHFFQRRSTNAQRLSIANTYTSTTNYESFSVDWQTTANTSLVGNRTAATGNSRAIMFVGQRPSGADQYASLRIDAASTDPIRIGFYDRTGAALAQSAFTNLVTLGEASNTGSSGVYTIVGIRPTYNQTGTAGGTDLLVNRTETGIGSGAHNLFDFQVGNVSRMRLTNTGTLIGLTSGVGSAIYALAATSAGDDPTEFLTQGRITTTDATVTTVQTIAIATSTNTVIGCYVTARRTGGAAGAAEDGAGYYLEVVMKNTAGTAAELAAETVRTIGESQAGWNVTSAPSGANELIQVTGAINNNVTWHSHCRTWPVNS